MAEIDIGRNQRLRTPPKPLRYLPHPLIPLMLMRINTASRDFYELA